MTKNEKIKNVKSIKALLASFDTHTRRRILWRLLTTSLSGNARSMNWLLKEFGKFIEKESDKLIRRFQ